MLNKIITLGSKKIGDGHPCFIIAEAGSNHNGSLQKALGLIDIAAQAGADAVKFQTFKAEKLYVPNAGKSKYLKLKKPIFEIIKDMEMPRTWIPKLAHHASKKKIIFLVSAFDEESVDLVDPYVPAFKIASYEMTDHPLVEYTARKGKPVLVSTGTANLAEVKETVRVISKAVNKNIVLMQCTASYPASLDSLNLKTIQTMKKKFGIPVGLSDHSREYDIAPLAAIGLGANCLEKHFTFSNTLPGPDHRFAIEPHELKLMVSKIRQAEKTLGDGVKRTLPTEKELHKFARRSIFSTKPIKYGEIFNSRNIGILRCGEQKGHLKPSEYKNILQKKAKRNIPPFVTLKTSDF